MTNELNERIQDRGDVIVLSTATNVAMLAPTKSHGTGVRKRCTLEKNVRGVRAEANFICTKTYCYTKDWHSQEEKKIIADGYVSSRVNEIQASKEKMISFSG